jgi:hypothetical protein
LGDLERLLWAVMKVPRRWVAVTLALAALSTLSVDHPANGGSNVEFEITTLPWWRSRSWLPALLRLLSLTGGRFKGAGVEVASGGLLGTPEDPIGDLTSLRTDAEEASRKSTVGDAGVGVMEDPNIPDWIDQVINRLQRAAACE